MSKYAVIRVGGRQYRVEEGEYLLVERLAHDEGAAFEPDVLLVSSASGTKFGDGLGSASVKAKVLEHVRGPKVIVGKHRRRTGYRRRNGHRSHLTRVQIDKILVGRGGSRKAAATSAAATPASATAAEEAAS